MIPKIIHQTWKTSKIPESFLHWQKSWIDMHPDFQYKLWTNEEIEDMIFEQDKVIQKLFFKYSKNICRIDLARYLILQKYGGLYVDLDFECLHPHHKLLNGHQLMMGLEPDSHSQRKKPVASGLRSIVCNAWIASEANHPFWSHLLTHLIKAQSNNDVLELTGPFALSRAIASYGTKDILIIPSKYIYPIDKDACWSGQVQDLEFFENNTRGAIAIHHWVGSWFRPSDYLSRLPLPLAKAFVRTASPTDISHSTPKDIGLNNQNINTNVQVSCLMVTRGNPHRIRHSIRSFLKQSIASKELVIVTDVPPQNLSLLQAEFSSENIIWIFSEPEKKLTLGQLRNLSIDSASGFYVAQWDDDDMFDPSRLEHQIDIIKKSKSSACMLSRWTVWWPSKNRLFISGKRSWEGSLVCERSVIPRYPSLSKAEDTVLIKELLSQNNVVFLDAPRLYIYVIHGENTWHEAHFEQLFNKASFPFHQNSYHKILNEISKRVDVNGYFKAINQHLSISKNFEYLSRPKLSNNLPSILILTPMKNTQKHLNRYFELIESLEYPKELISIGILEGDSEDGTWHHLMNLSSEKQSYFSSLTIDKFDTGYRVNGPRWAREIQYKRRSTLAKVRNTLLNRTLAKQDWVLWIDADVIDYPADLIHRLLSVQKDIVVPMCTRADGSVFDKNTFIFEKNRESSERSEYLLDGIYQPPESFGRRYLDSVEPSLVPVDSVGGTVLLVRADLHREGLMFPTFSYRGYIETEGLAFMAKDMGIQCWGIKSVNVIHAND